MSLSKSVYNDRDVNKIRENLSLLKEDLKQKTPVRSGKKSRLEQLTEDNKKIQKQLEEDMLNEELGDNMSPSLGIDTMKSNLSELTKSQKLLIENVITPYKHHR